MRKPFTIIVLRTVLLPPHRLKELGDILMMKFKWGSSFFEVNQKILDMYAKCKNSAEVVKAQQDYLSDLGNPDESALAGT